jgi:hypothetical protein
MQRLYDTFKHDLEHDGSPLNHQWLDRQHVSQDEHAALINLIQARLIIADTHIHRQATTGTVADWNMPNTIDTAATT